MLVQAERAAHCADVRPGKARVFMCLLAHIESADYRPGCRDQLSSQQQRRIQDWRLDYDLRQACKDDVPKVPARLPSNESCSAGLCLWCHCPEASSVTYSALPGTTDAELPDMSGLERRFLVQPVRQCSACTAI